MHVIDWKSIYMLVLFIVESTHAGLRWGVFAVVSGGR